MQPKEYPINEIYGPVYQGEVPVSEVVNFVRFAGCDCDCSWCDTKYAVRPSYPGWTSTPMTADEIANALEMLKPRTSTVVLSGGNPALFVNLQLILALGEAGYMMQIETQGTRFVSELVLRSFFLKQLILSPKPPSSGMAQRTMNEIDTIRRMIDIRKASKLEVTLKYVAFDDIDLEWVLRFHEALGTKEAVPTYISAGSPINPDECIDDIRATIIERAGSLQDQLLHKYSNTFFRVIMQQHALIHGPKRGV